MTAPEGSEERSHQEHVADRAEANDQDVGEDGVGGHERIYISPFSLLSLRLLLAHAPAQKHSVGR